MTVVSTTKDTEGLSFTLVAEFTAPRERVWQVWADPRQLERWWGPPTWPATFEQHDVTVGGRSTYYMTGPEGEKSRGWLQFTAIDEPRSLAFDDGFSDDSGAPDPKMPTIRMSVALDDAGGGTRMTVTSRFESAEQMRQLLEMGMVEGMEGAAGQIDAILAGG